MTQPRSEYERTVPLEPYHPQTPVAPVYGEVVHQASNPYAGQVQPWQQPTSVAGPPVYAYGVAPVDPRWQQYQLGLYAAQKSRVAAGLLALFLGGLGIHNFYLGRVGVGIAQLLITVLSAGFLAVVVCIWALIEGIMILAGSASFRTDAKGIPLRG